VLVRHDHYVEEPLGAPQQWFPPLSIEDSAVVDEFIVRLCGALFPSKWRWSDDELYAPIIRFWLSRLPISGEEVWAVCAAHGMPDRFRKRIASGFEFGRGLLVVSHGRPPIQRRRVAPMSIARYEPQKRKKAKTVLI
jgi:hypothetical protein